MGAQARGELLKPLPGGYIHLSRQLRLRVEASTGAACAI